MAVRSIATASFVVNYGADSYIAVELDEDKNGGQTTFKPGDTVYFKVYADCDYAITTSVGASAAVPNTRPGSAVAETGDDGTGIEEIVEFVKTKTASTSKLIKESTTVTIDKWMSSLTPPTSISKSGTQEVKIETSTAAKDLLAAAIISYTSEYYEHELTFPGGITDSIWTTIVYVYEV